MQPEQCHFEHFSIVSGLGRSGSFDVEQPRSLEHAQRPVVMPRVNAIPVLTKLRQNLRRGGGWSAQGLHIFQQNNFSNFQILSALDYQREGRGFNCHQRLQYVILYRARGRSYSVRRYLEHNLQLYCKLINKKN